MGMLPNYFPILVELKDGTRMMRALRDLEHSTLCAAFSLDPCSTYFDLPSTFRGVGSSMGIQNRNTRRDVSGFIFQGPKGSDPIGRIRMTFEGDKFGNEHMEDSRDFENLGR